MKKVLSCLILLLAFFSLAAGELRPLSGGVCLRYDDNQKPEVWRAMMKTFAAHGGHFSASLNMLDFTDEYFPIVRELAAAGHEIIDHAPNHRMFKFRAADQADFARFRHHPGVAYADEKSRWLYLKYTVDLNRNHPKGRGSFRNGKLYDPVPAEIFKKIPANFPRMIYIPSQKKLAAVRNSAEKGLFDVCSFYDNQSAGLPELTDAEFIWPRERGMIQPDDQALMLLIEAVQKRCKNIGIAPPAVWVQPAGWEPIMQTPAMLRTYAKMGYKAADCLENRLAWFYGDPDFAVSRYGTSARALSLDIAELPQVKTLIADSVAQHHVLTIIAHIRTRNMEKYLSDTGKLLAWLKEHDIPLAGMEKWTDHLASASTPADAEIMPDCRTDRDGNGRADGFFASPGTSFTITADGAKLQGKGPGKLEIPSLCGMRKGKNIFRILLKGHPGAPVRFTFIQRDSLNRVKATATHGAVFDQNGIMEKTFEIDIQTQTAQLYTGLAFISLKTPVIVQKISLQAKK